MASQWGDRSDSCLPRSRVVLLPYSKLSAEFGHVPEQRQMLGVWETMKNQAGNFALTVVNQVNTEGSHPSAASPWQPQACVSQRTKVQHGKGSRGHTQPSRFRGLGGYLHRASLLPGNPCRSEKDLSAACRKLPRGG